MTLTQPGALADPDARRIARDWFARFEAAFTGEPETAAAARAQLETHLIEALEGDASATPDQVRAALTRLGAPEALAAEWSGHAGAPATPGSPRRVMARLALQAGRGLATVFGGLFLIAALARLVDPASVGLFQLEDGTWLLGTRNDRTVIADTLGAWTAPLALLVALGFLLLGTAGLGLWRAAVRRARRFLG